MRHLTFHEDTTIAIAKRRTLPEDVWLPDPGVEPYRGRG